MKKTIALKDADKYNNISAEDLERITPQMRLRDSVKKWEEILDPQAEENFDEEVPEGDVTEAQEVADEVGAEPEAFVDETGEGEELHDNQGVRSDEAFDKELFLPIEEIKELAPSYAEDYGYDKGFDAEGNYNGYIAPAGPQKRSELKALLIRTYEGIIARSQQSERIKNKESFEKAQREVMNRELAEIDKLNDLEASHAITYYKKIQMANRRYDKKHRQPEPEEE